MNFWKFNLQYLAFICDHCPTDNQFHWQAVVIASPADSSQDIVKEEVDAGSDMRYRDQGSMFILLG